ncbi:helix-turn-helix domain-containing protein [Photobacterium sp. 2_MG-2023]|uniref:helix-turn-helix domain-containing protein n=1 Tax=Photobacterium sp. 2_MG-2023 TaxID=3062663 RepID=UPI0034A1CCA7
MQLTHALFFEELHDAREACLSLPLPSDRRLSAWLNALHLDQQNAPSLKVLSEQVGASSKTISRLFIRETGMPYQNWRQQWRLLKAIELLSAGLQVNDAAYRLEFSSDSAFITFFKQQTGQTPLHYIRGGH